MISRNFYVYVHRRPATGEVFYVGKGTAKKGYSLARAYSHQRRNIHWHRIINQHGLEVEVVAYFDEESLAFQLEIDLIAHYGRQEEGGCLCNMTTGGEGGSGRFASEETKLKMSISAQGKARSEEHCANLSKAMMGRIPSLEQRAKHSLYMRSASNPHLGKTQSEATKAKKSLSMMGKTKGAKHVFFGIKRPAISEKMRGGGAPLARKVFDESTGVHYECIKYAAEAIGMSPVLLSRWLSGDRTNKSTMRYAL